jgi:SAM-dependent methyltransferase
VEGTVLQFNVERVLEMVGPKEKVLDVGGWYMPFSRANWVIDILPYETRAPSGQRLGPLPERFNQDTWIQRDICARDPFPFTDKEFDFVVCSHVLEDVRDPVFVCSELVRVAKSGYIETPAFDVDLTFGFDSRSFAGYAHHRWLCAYSPNRIDFFYKPHFVNGEWNLHFPASYRRSGLALQKTGDKRNSWLFWEDRFEFAEAFRTDTNSYKQEIEAHVRERGGYPPWRYALEAARSPGGRVLGRAKSGLGRIVRHC